jgi:hypothetical protein
MFSDQRNAGSVPEMASLLSIGKRGTFRSRKSDFYEKMILSRVS